MGQGRWDRSGRDYGRGAPSGFGVFDGVLEAGVGDAEERQRPKVCLDARVEPCGACMVPAVLERHLAQPESGVGIRED